MTAKKATAENDAPAPAAVVVKGAPAASDVAVAVHKQTLVDLLAAVEAGLVDDAKAIAARIKL